MNFLSDLDKGILGEPDSRELWMEILSQPELFKACAKADRILNVAGGHGTEVDVLVELHGEDIVKKIWFNDQFICFTNGIMLKYPDINSIEGDFLEQDFKDMKKFDVVVGNPPYNIGTSQHKYIDFVKCAEQLCTVASAYIIPIAWTYSPRFSNFLKFLIQNGLMDVTFLTREEFPGILQDVCKITLRKDFSDKITVYSNTRSSILLSRDSTSLIPHTNDVVSSIINKTKGPGLILCKGKNATVRHHGDKIFDSYISKSQNKSHKHKLLSRLGGSIEKNEIFWISDKKSEPNSYKIVTSGLQPSTGSISYWQVVDSSYCISTALVYIQVDSLLSAENGIAYLSSKMVKFLFREHMRTARMSSALMSKIPIISFDKKMTDAEIYQHFGLTQEEIDYIEANVK